MKTPRELALLAKSQRDKHDEEYVIYCVERLYERIESLQKNIFDNQQEVSRLYNQIQWFASLPDETPIGEVLSACNRISPPTPSIVKITGHLLSTTKHPHLFTNEYIS